MFAVKYNNSKTSSQRSTDEIRFLLFDLLEPPVCEERNLLPTYILYFVHFTI